MRRTLESALIPSMGPIATGRFLTNASYQVFINASGSGCSTYGDYALTPPRTDTVEDGGGFFLYLRDRDDPGAFYSLGQQPTKRRGDAYTAHWQPGSFSIERMDNGIEARLDVCVTATAPFELRRVVLTNRSGRARRLELTSYVEVALSEARAYAAHPAFAKLFVQTRFVAERRVLVAERRARTPHERHPSMLHALVDGRVTSFETDRSLFLGRGGSYARPEALTSPDRPAQRVGNVLDPVLSLCGEVDLAPEESRECTWVLGATFEPAAAMLYFESLAQPGAVRAAFEEAGAAEQEQLSALSINATDAESLQVLASAILRGHPALVAGPNSDSEPSAERVELQSMGLSPNRTFAVVDAETPHGAALVTNLERAHRYWRALRLPIDVVVLSDTAERRNDSSGYYVRRRAEMSPAEITTLYTEARWVVTQSWPTGALFVRSATPTEQPRVVPLSEPSSLPRDARAPEDLRFFNGYGGFTADGKEYVIRLPAGGKRPPQPWTNVVANERFGFLISESGAGCTWNENSREHRLTQWTNDAVLDAHTEAFYIRDDESGAFWSLWPGPCPGEAAYEVRHGFGYSTCRQVNNDLEQLATHFVPGNETFRVASVRLRNLGQRRRRLSLYAYARLEPENGQRARGRSFASAQVVRSLHATCNPDYFIGGESIGGEGSIAHPEALRRPTLDDDTGNGWDACVAQQVVLDLEPNAETEVCFLFGEARDADEARTVVARYATVEALGRALEQVRTFWSQGVSGVRISTPSPMLDLMVNGWLPYQVLACRLWARSAFYQSGGAFGFRDQLQDAASLVYLWPEITRAQIVLHAEHQFVEGDVLHWWHPPMSCGIRTRFADDLLWLPYVTAYYVRTMGDSSLLDEPARYLTARGLRVGEDEAFLEPMDSGTRGSIYEHCCRALDRSLAVGKNGLPLFGTGDWNDGMNRVGREGRGESVWMGFFLHTVLDEFALVCRQRGDTERARRYDAHRQHLRVALNEAGWDGEWYRRGYYDNGEPLGSKQSQECRIDALVQAWAVLSGAAPHDRARSAMAAVEHHLISDADQLIRLLTPPFDTTANDPGYIKGYIPGVRENGGQYTHAALWVVRALAQLGDNDRAAELLDMLNPISHTRTPEAVERYRVEPYVVAADVYGTAPHVGRGGWTWYTGSAGWMYRVALESVLGLEIEAGNMLRIAPCIPHDWPEYTIEYRVPGTATQYEIRVLNPIGDASTVVAVVLDGRTLAVEAGTARVPIVRDDSKHRIEITLGRTGERTS